GLTADAEAVVRLIDGKATAARIASEGPADPFAVEKLLAALVTLGLVYPEFVAPEGAAVPPEFPPPAAARPAGQPPAPEPSAPLRVEPLAAESAEEEVAEQAVEDFEEGETGEHPARFGELDVPPAPPAPEPSEPELDEELDEDLDEELDRPEASEDTSESAVGDYEIAEAGADAADAAESISSRDAEPTLEYEPEDAPQESIGVGEPPESTGPTSLEPDTKSPLPLDYTTGVGSVERPAPRSGARWLWVLVLLAAGVGAVVLLRGGGAAPPTRLAATRESPTPAPVPTEATPALSAMVPPTQAAARLAAPTPAQRVAATTIVAPNARASVLPSAPTPAPKAPPTVAAKAPMVVPRATARPMATAAPAKTASAQTPASAETAGASRQSWLDRASRDRQKANADRRNHFTIQLELACETQTLLDAWKHDRPAGTMWLLTSAYEGKTCFRVLWGRYPSKEAARRALSGIPSFFSSNHNRPVVAAIR
ncbi:MAG TPA: hypothetical protein VGO79_07685, partial [Thermoanaerobaculia bacterium]